MVFHLTNQPINNTEINIMSINKDHYGFKIKRIKNIDEIEANKTLHYTYELPFTDIHFLYSPVPNAKGLLITFHGAYIPTSMQLPLFRGYDYSERIQDISILSITDPLIYEYSDQKLRLSWFLDTEKFPSSEYLLKIFNHVKKMNSNDNILFFGTSGGGFPAIKYASILKTKALVSNSQTLLNKYYYFEEFIEIIESHRDHIIEPHDIRKQIDEYGYPKKLMFYINKLDLDHFNYHAEPFHEYFKKNRKLNILDYHPFNGEAHAGKTPHHVLWDCKLENLIYTMLDT